jgi:phenylacetate-CoA ligase
MTCVLTARLSAWDGIDGLRTLQDARLGAALERATRSPFYRRRLGSALPTTRAELADTPLTTKQDLRENYPYGMLAVPSHTLATYHESSGTAGAPTASYYTESDWDDLTERWSRKWIGITAADVVMVRTPYALMMTGHLAHAGARRSGATVVPADNRSVATPHARVLRLLHDLGVTLTWSLPTETLLWAAAARRAGLRPDRDFPHLRALVVAGEPLSDVRRARIAHIWGVPVVEDYGSTETGGLAGQCPAGRLHLWADRVLFEVYDPQTGRIAMDGRGELVVTPLCVEAMPLLRYNVEDEVEVSYEPCGCGWRLPTVRVLGRSGGGYRVGSAEVTPLRLEELVFGLPPRYDVWFWRGRAEPNRLVVELEVAEEHRIGACARLTDAIRREWGVESLVMGVPPGHLVPVERLTRLPEMAKPRGLVGPGESWDNAILHY